MLRKDCIFLGLKFLNIHVATVTHRIDGLEKCQCHRTMTMWRTMHLHHPHRRDTVTVPKFNDGEQLQVWAVSKGLPEAKVGMSTMAYYQLLCHVLERRQQEKDA